jgi:hypothetical protein
LDVAGVVEGAVLGLGGEELSLGEFINVNEDDFDPSYVLGIVQDLSWRPASASGTKAAAAPGGSG